MFIYKITNRVNGKVYVEKTKKLLDKRLKTHTKEEMISILERKINEMVSDK